MRPVSADRRGRKGWILALRTASLLAAIALVSLAMVRPALAGPPFPEPVAGQRVYDTAGIWSAATTTAAEGIVAAIERQTSAQVVVYSQIKSVGVTGAQAEADAQALGTQWGVGRQGFNDGLVILFDIEPNRVHGQVAMVGGDGFRAAYLDDAATKRIIDSSVVPKLTGGTPDFDAAMLAGLRAVAEQTTPASAADLERARIINAILGIILAPLALLLIIGWAAFNWLRHGRDPVYTDDPSVLMPAPPAELTAATGALIYDGASSRRGLTTALLDLASRGELAFEEHHQLLTRKVGILTHGVAAATEEEAARRRLNARRPLSEAETYALHELRTISAGSAPLQDAELLKFGTKVDEFNTRLEAHAVANGWFGRPPAKVKLRWLILGSLEIMAGAGALIVGVSVPISGLVVLGVAVIIGGAVTAIISQAMPARTKSGAMIRAMLAAYRRTLERTMAQARSMTQVVSDAGLPWLETPDQALVWGVALGLQGPVEQVLSRSTEDLRAGQATLSPLWFPAWYGSRESFAAGAAGGAGGSLFSGSAVPDFGGMFGVLKSVGNAPSSSGSGGGFGGGGGFSGGSSGGF